MIKLYKDKLRSNYNVLVTSVTPCIGNESHLMGYIGIHDEYAVYLYVDGSPAKLSIIGMTVCKTPWSFDSLNLLEDGPIKGALIQAFLEIIAREPEVELKLGNYVITEMLLALE